MTITQKIKEFILDQGITQISIAKKTGIPQSHLSQSLNGKRKLSAEEFKLICVALKKPPNYFMPDLPKGA